MPLKCPRIPLRALLCEESWMTGGSQIHADQNDRSRDQHEPPKLLVSEQAQPQERKHLPCGATVRDAHRWMGHPKVESILGCELGLSRGQNASRCGEVGRPIVQEDDQKKEKPSRASYHSHGLWEKPEERD